MGVVTDPIADMLTRIRNANAERHTTCDIPTSKTKLAIAQILLDEGFISSFERVENPPQGLIRVTLKYGPERERVITNLRRISKPGLRVYSAKSEIPRVLGGLGCVIISTSKGVMSGKRAKREGLGGEVMAYVW